VSAASSTTIYHRRKQLLPHLAFDISRSRSNLLANGNVDPNFGGSFGLAGTKVICKPMLKVTSDHGQDDPAGPDFWF